MQYFYDSLYQTSHRVGMQETRVLYQAESATKLVFRHRLLTAQEARAFLDTILQDEIFEGISVKLDFLKRRGGATGGLRFAVPGLKKPSRAPWTAKLRKGLLTYSEACQGHYAEVQAWNQAVRAQNVVNEYFVCVPPSMRTKWVIIHELGHVLQCLKRGYNRQNLGAIGHGEDFRGYMLYLLGKVDPAIAIVFWDSFRRAGLSIDPDTERMLSAFTPDEVLALRSGTPQGF